MGLVYYFCEPLPRRTVAQCVCVYVASSLSLKLITNGILTGLILRQTKRLVVFN